MFTISQGKGFQLTFKNGWTVSVQFGTGNYCERQNYQAKFESERNTRRWQSLTAEIAAWSASKKWYSFGDDTVKGHVSSDEVALFIDKVRKFKR